MEVNQILKNELDNNEIPKKYFNLYKKLIIFLSHAFSMAKWLTISVGILAIFLAIICISNEKFASYFENLIVKGSRSYMQNIFIIFIIFISLIYIVSCFFALLLAILKKRLVDLTSKLEKVKWLEMLNLFNDNNFEINSINIETFLIEKVELEGIFIPNSSKKILIKNEIGLKTKKGSLIINFSNIFFDFENEQIVLEITYELDWMLSEKEIEQIKQKNKYFILINLEEKNSYFTIRKLIFDMNPFIKLKKNEVKLNLSYYKEFNFSNEIFGFFIENKYSKENREQVFQENINKSLKKIEDLLWF